MSGKSKSTHYSEMRNVVLGMNKNRNKLKPEIVPGLFTFIVMLSKRYAKQAEGFRHVHITRGIPGMAEAAERMSWACEHLNMLAQLLPQPFSRDDWNDAAADTCAALGINPGDLPVMELDVDALAQALPVLPDATDTDAAGDWLEPGVRDHAEPENANGRAPVGGSQRGGGPDLERDGAPGRNGPNPAKKHRAGRKQKPR